MNADLETIKKRIKKLLALSKSPNENEAMAALQKAQELMEAYHITEAKCVYTYSYMILSAKLVMGVQKTITEMCWHMQ